MLGWFKKKFGKQQAEIDETSVPEQSIQPPAGEETVVAAEQAAAWPATAPAVPTAPVAPVEPEISEPPPVTAEATSPEPEELALEPIEPLVPELAESPSCEPGEPLRLASPELQTPGLVGAEKTLDLPIVSEQAERKGTDPLPDTAGTAAEAGAAGVTETATEAIEAEKTEVLPSGEETPAEPDQAGVDVAIAPAVEADSEPDLKPLAAPTQEKPAAKSLFQRLQERLGKTRDALAYRLDQLFLGKKEIDQDLFDQVEEILITADLGVAFTLELLEVARKKIKRDQLSDPQVLKAIIRDQLLAHIEASEQPAELVMPTEGPFVIMVVGVNGVGKTTTIGKLAAKFVRAGQSVLLVAGDTFRAAAINQLKIWGERVGVEVVAQNPGADPSSVVFDGLTYGVAHGHEVIIIDTAGRLHTSVNLMEELKKIKRVIGKKMPGAPHEIMLVLDATTGQNGISQAKLFHQAVGISGLTLTKLDGTAKGGIVANVCRELKIPVRFIGIGEQIDDLRDFEATEFVEALFASQTD
ncbi:MAG: signal recognition particle-docking protein FtsY [Proteobacteria bacterium]|nr:signal recognition particle-docking protein FtsY [Pseudomonadota bacterium]